MATILFGKPIQEKIASGLKARVVALARPPVLAILQVGDLADSNSYIRAKQRFAETIGVSVRLHKFGAEIEEKGISDRLDELNSDPIVSGIIVQLPLPKHLAARKILDRILVGKDADGLTSYNLSRFLGGEFGATAPATARGVLALLDEYSLPIEGRNVVVVGRSAWVGRPVAAALLNRNATVTVCHSHTGNLPEVTRAADILVVAAGKRGLIGAEHVRSGQVVIDIGINAVSASAVLGEALKRAIGGDVNFETVKEIVAAITPVPGGVGPLTVASLFQNLLGLSEAAV